MWWTIISSFLTAISIVFSIISIVNAKKAREYKEEVLDFKNIIDFKGAAEKYKEAHLKFLQEVRSELWYKGKNVNIVISPMESVLTNLASVYPLLEDSFNLKKIVKRVSTKISQFDNCEKDDRKEVFSDLAEIEEILQEELYKQTFKAVK